MNNALRNIQSELNAPKNQYNPFGKFNYRSCEGILESVKPLLKKYGAELILTDKIINMGERFYVEATAIFTCEDDTVVVTALAREPDSKKGMDESQITGSASSYARKYALNGLFLIDDNKDSDTVEQHNEIEERQRRDDPVIGEKQIEQIEELAEDKGVPLDAICERFDVMSIEELTMTEFIKAVKMLEATKRRD